MAQWGRWSWERKGGLPPRGEKGHASVRHIVRDMDEFEKKEQEVLALISSSLGGRDPELNYAKQMDQHYIVLVSDEGAEVRS